MGKHTIIPTKQTADCIILNDERIREGDKFTIEGISLREDGSFAKCKSGDETLFTAKLRINGDS
jgi:hypothetical protein